MTACLDAGLGFALGVGFEMTTDVSFIIRELLINV